MTPQYVQRRIVHFFSLKYVARILHLTFFILTITYKNIQKMMATLPTKTNCYKLQTFI